MVVLLRCLLDCIFRVLFPFIFVARRIRKRVFEKRLNDLRGLRARRVFRNLFVILVDIIPRLYYY